MFAVKPALNARVVLCVLATLSASAATAQPAVESYPNKAIRFVCPFPPGGANDLLARLFAQKMADTLGQQVFVDNRGGAGGIIGAEAGARAPADGYTITIDRKSTRLNSS